MSGVNEAGMDGAPKSGTEEPTGQQNMQRFRFFALSALQINLNLFSLF